jgi:hypothetical protein
MLIEYTSVKTSQEYALTVSTRVEHMQNLNMEISHIVQVDSKKTKTKQI